MYTYIHYNVILLCHKKEWNLTISHNMDVSGECVISSVLSHHNKHMKWWTLKPLVSHNSQTVLQLCVIAQLYLDNKGKYILEAWRHADPKDAKRRKRERAGEHRREEESRQAEREWGTEGQRERGREGERPPALWLLFLCVFFLFPLSLPYVNWASQECCLFHLKSSVRSSDLPLFYFHGLFPYLSFSHRHSGLFCPILTT